MRNSQQVWEVYLTSKNFNTRPSDLLDVSDPYAAFCLDSAVSQFGRSLENALASVEGKGKTLQVKRDQLMRKWLDMPQQYRGPS